MNYHPSQLAAIRHTGGPALVLAGPGSGKTAVITGRVGFLTETGVPPSSILVVTFTRAAAREMELRLHRAGAEVSGAAFSTCHALFFRILRSACGYTTQDILTAGEKRRLLKELLQQSGIDSSEDMIEYAASDISRAKNAEDFPQEVFWCTPERFRSIFDAYNAALRSRHKIEFDDMAPLCEELFASAPEELARRQQAWQHVLIDEFQDLSRPQYALLRRLAAPQNCLFAVGDEDQSVYSFRGASPQLIRQFRRDFPDAATYLLDRNYRCTEEIIAPAQRLISFNTQRISRTIRGTGRSGAPVSVCSASDQHAEAQLVADDLRRQIKEGIPADRIAVLYRSRGSAYHLQRVFSEEMIPYRTKHRETDLYAHWIAQDLFAYADLASDPDNIGALLRILNRPQRDLPQEIFTRAGLSMEERMMQLTPQERGNLLRLQRDLGRIALLRPYAALCYILDGIGYRRVLTEHAASRGTALAELMRIPERLCEEAVGYETFAEWKEAIRLQRMRRSDQIQETSGILLSTIHGAKGLEFDSVWITDANETLLPIRSAVSGEALEEERRLFYVAMTRAREALSICTIERYRVHALEPSRFLIEAGLMQTAQGLTKKAETGKLSFIGQAKCRIRERTGT